MFVRLFFLIVCVFVHLPLSVAQADCLDVFDQRFDPQIQSLLTDEKGTKELVDAADQLTIEAQTYYRNYQDMVPEYNRVLDLVKTLPKDKTAKQRQQLYGMCVQGLGYVSHTKTELYVPALKKYQAAFQQHQDVIQRGEEVLAGLNRQKCDAEYEAYVAFMKKFVSDKKQFSPKFENRIQALQGRISELDQKIAYFQKVKASLE